MALNIFKGKTAQAAFISPPAWIHVELCQQATCAKESLAGVLDRNPSSHDQYLGRCSNKSFAVADCEDSGVTECFRRGVLKAVLAFQAWFGDMEQDKRKKSTSSFVGGDAAKVPKWAQKTVTLPAAKRGCHLVTPTILKDVEADLAHFQCGLAHFFLQHTSASLTINENYDSDVLDDVETWLTGTVPEGRKAPWKHTIEGPDDMPAHIKSSVFGCALSIPITDGRLNLGTWQGIWLCEHRDHASARKVVVTMTGV